MNAAAANEKEQKRHQARLEYRRRYYAANKEKWRRDHEANREKRLAQRRAKHAAQPEVKKAQDLMTRFGISLEQYSAMLVAQQSLCAICRGPERSIDPRTKSRRMLAVDHCHATGKVRALLCSHCNRGLGMLNDSPALLRAALNYLEEHQ